MNATSIDELRVAAQQRDGKDERMEQIRQLLFGDHAQEVATRFMLMEARLRELETGVARQLDVIQSRIDQLTAEAAGDRRAAFEELAVHMRDLSDRISGISKK